jgi:hypothetical protein
MTITEPGVASAMLQPHPDTTKPTLDPETIAEIDGIVAATGTTLPRPTREACIEAIIHEANCGHTMAAMIDDFWAIVTYSNRSQSHATAWSVGFDGQIHKGCYHLGEDDLYNLHAILEIIAPDDHRSELGSGTAHDLLDRRHCDPGLGERGLVHGKTGDEPRNCMVYIDLVTID